MMRLAAVGALALLGLAPIGAQEAREPTAEAAAEPAGVLEVEVTPTTATVGDRLVATLNLTVSKPLAGRPRFPVWEENWGDAEILGVGDPEQIADGVWRQAVTVAIFETGLATLPKPAVEVPTVDATATVVAEDPFVIDVQSVLPEGEEEPKPQPPAPPRELPIGERFWWTTGVLGLACAVLGFLVFRAASQVARTLATLSLTPIEALERALGELRGETDGERIVTGLSLEFRRYLGRAIGFPAAEGTTTEIQRELRGQEVPTELLRPTVGLLREADQVKFARASIDAARAAARLDEIERLAHEVEEWLHPAPAEDENPEVAA